MIGVVRTINFKQQFDRAPVVIVEVELPMGCVLPGVLMVEINPDHTDPRRTPRACVVPLSVFDQHAPAITPPALQGGEA